MIKTLLKIFDSGITKLLVLMAIGVLGLLFGYLMGSWVYGMTLLLIAYLYSEWKIAGEDY